MNPLINYTQRQGEKLCRQKQRDASLISTAICCTDPVTKYSFGVPGKCHAISAHIHHNMQTSEHTTEDGN